MTKRNDRSSKVAASSGAALAAVMLGSAGLAAQPVPPQEGQPPASSERSANFEKWSGQLKPTNWIKLKSEYKHKGEYYIAGQDQGRIIFKDERGHLFYVDEATGDQKFVSSKALIKIEIGAAGYQYHTIKLSNKVAILGLDESGRTIMRNASGEAFRLDPATGDMIFLK